MDPAIFVLLTACGLGFFALMGAARLEERPKRVLWEPEPFDASAAEA